MNLHRVIKQAGKFAQDNSPLILTTVGAVGVLTTAYLSGQAGFKAALILIEEDHKAQVENPDAPPFNSKQVFNITWKCYIPPAISAVGTVAAIVGANQIGTRRTVAMTTALALSEKAFETYKDKVVEKVGEKKANVIRDEVVQDQMDRNPIGRNEIIVTGRGDVNVYETYTGRYFKSSVEAIKSAQNNINYRVNNDGYASLSDLYDELGLSHTDISDDMGWNSTKLLEIEIIGHVDETGMPCLGVIYQTIPVRDYWKFRG